MTGKISTEDVQLHLDKMGAFSNSMQMLSSFQPIKDFDKNTSFIIHRKVCRPCQKGLLSAWSTGSADKHNTNVNSDIYQTQILTPGVVFFFFFPPAPAKDLVP